MDFTPPTKVVCNLNIVHENLKSENSQDYAQKPQRNRSSWIRLLVECVFLGTNSAGQAKDFSRNVKDCKIYTFHILTACSPKNLLRRLNCMFLNRNQAKTSQTAPKDEYLLSNRLVLERFFVTVSEALCDTFCCSFVSKYLAISLVKSTFMSLEAA